MALRGPTPTSQRADHGVERPEDLLWRLYLGGPLTVQSNPIRSNAFFVATLASTGLITNLLPDGVTPTTQWRITPRGQAILKAT